MVTLSVDCGYSYTKTNTRLIFPSNIMHEGDLINGADVVYRGDPYGIGYGHDESASYQIRRNQKQTLPHDPVCLSPKTKNPLL